MPIITYRTASASDYQGAGPDYDRVEPHAINHVSTCPRGRQGWPDTSRKTLTNDCVRHGCRIGYLCYSHTGRVLSTGERNGYHDSDFYARVWTGERIESVDYATTRGWTYFNNAVVDATSEVLEEVERFEAERRRKAQEARDKHRAEMGAIRAAMPAFGQKWRVKSKCSKLPHGALVEIASEPELSGYADPLNGGRYSQRPLAVGLGIMEPECLEERYRERPGDIRLKVRLADGSTRWCSASVLEPAAKQPAAA